MSAKLLCVEKVNQDTREAQYDRVIYNDNRVLKNLLLQQDISLPRFNYFKQIQSDIQPYMRKVVANWMMEVCEDQRCEVQVFPLAMNLMDRFLCTHDVKKCQLQLTGATCLLIASKTRQCIQIPVHLLCHYTENSITPNDLRDWEMLIMSKLRWKVYAVTGCDFIEHLLQELDVSNDSRIRDHAHTLLALACTGKY
ncbi:hypothetical protein O3M35_004012 [Rhynocoris fuscipes]|uniref:Cyclin-like domain-containing protein n=1 Tax=Rhynocoris fuscipes TaxID=488301 RepID=A0AAW1CKV7_9HEMI